MKIRPQYHFRNSDRGLLAWNVASLIEIVSGMEPLEIKLSEVSELDEPYWFELGDDAPTCRTIAEHAQLIEEADLSYPIIVDLDGRVMDGMHRVCKALGLGRATIQAYRLPEVPEPDFVGVDPNDLPYEPVK